MLRGHVLPLEINVGAKVNDLADGPSQNNSYDASENPHGASFCEKQFSHVPVAGPNRFHDPDLAAPFENRHHQRVYDSDGGNSQREAAKNSEKQIQHGEELSQAARCIED